MTLSEQFRALLILVNMILLIILGAETLLYYVVYPRMAIKKIYLDGDLDVGDKTILKLLDLTDSANFRLYEPEVVAEKLMRYNLIKSAELKKVFPSSLKVTLMRRHPIAAMIVKGDDYDRPAMIDEDGLVYRIGIVEDINLPILSGLEIPGIKPGIKLPRRLDPLFEGLNSLKSDHPALYTLVSEVNLQLSINSTTTDIYLTSYPTIIRTDGFIDSEVVQTAMVSLEVLERGGALPRVLDMRTSGIVYENTEGGLS